MGPIADNPQRAIELSRLIETLAADREMLQAFMESPGDWTRSGRPVANPLTSKARIGDIAGAFRNASNDVSGRTVQYANRQLGTMATEEAIMRAAQALAGPVPTTEEAIMMRAAQAQAQALAAPVRPPARPVPRADIMRGAGAMNPLLMLVMEALTRHTPANEGEQQELDKRRLQPPTIDR